MLTAWYFFVYLQCQRWSLWKELENWPGILHCYGNGPPAWHNSWRIWASASRDSWRTCIEQKWDTNMWSYLCVCVVVLAYSVYTSSSGRHWHEAASLPRVLPVRPAVRHGSSRLSGASNWHVPDHKQSSSASCGPPTHQAVARGCWGSAARCRI